MALQFSFLKKSREWAIIGPADEVQLGPVSLLNKRGELKHETIIKLGPVFDYGGGPMRYGFISILPQHRNSTVVPYQRYEFPVETRKLGTDDAVE